LVGVSYDLSNIRNVYFSLSFIAPSNSGIDIKNKILGKYLAEINKIDNHLPNHAFINMNND